MKLGIFVTDVSKYTEKNERKIFKKQRLLKTKPFHYYSSPNFMKPLLAAVFFDAIFAYSAKNSSGRRLVTDEIIKRGVLDFSEYKNIISDIFQRFY